MPDDDAILLRLFDQDDSYIEVRRYDTLQSFGGAAGPREWRDWATITTTAGAANAARAVLSNRFHLGQPWRIVRDGRVILK